MKNDINSLEFALEKGNFYIRQSAAEKLGNLKSIESISILEKKIDDKIMKVSLATMNALERIGVTDELRLRIENKKEYWIQESIRRSKIKKNLNRADEVLRWHRPSSKVLANVKEMLKKPMNTGKWI